MSKALHDSRVKLTGETKCAINAEMETSGRTEQDIVRQVMHEWALEKIRKATVLARHVAAEGMAGELGGTRGHKREGRG